MNGTKSERAIAGRTAFRGAISIGLLILVWELGSRFKLPGLVALPPPSSVLHVIAMSVTEAKFWNDWLASLSRVMTGFVAAQIVGVPLGLAMATSRVLYATTFPLLEIMRPIPPLAWVPASIIFWPTTESSIAFVIFLGAFFTVVLNVLGSARNIDERYLRAARSLGSRPSDMFWRIVFPAVLPGVFIGMAVGMGVTWEVVVAAEMIAGKSGLGYLTWSSYVGGDYPQIILGMLSIGVAGYGCSSLIRLLGRFATPWQRAT